MDAPEYLHYIARDGAALATAAEGGLDASVPTCPGWTVRDLVAHTGVVHRHKERIVREAWLGSMPEPVEAPAADLLGWYREGLRALVDTLASRDPAEPCATWFPGDETVGFWYRRMAHETAVHRVDAELAFGTSVPVDTALAADGVDELLGVMIVDAPPWAAMTEGSALLELATTDADASWTLREMTWSGVSPGGMSYEEEPGYVFSENLAADAALSGSASDLLLFGWGRNGDERLVLDGDPAFVARFHRVAREATR